MVFLYFAVAIYARDGNNLRYLELQENKPQAGFLQNSNIKQDLTFQMTGR